MREQMFDFTKLAFCRLPNRLYINSNIWFSLTWWCSLYACLIKFSYLIIIITIITTWYPFNSQEHLQLLLLLSFSFWKSNCFDWGRKKKHSLLLLKREEYYTSHIEGNARIWQQLTMQTIFALILIIRCHLRKRAIISLF